MPGEVFKFDNGLVIGLVNFKKKYKQVSTESKKKVGLALLNYINNGSPRESVVPPVLDGFLRGSATVFVGDSFIGQSEGFNSRFANTGSSGTKNAMIITVGYNAPYAAAMHEHEGNWGPVSQQSGDVGNKFIEKHLKNDGRLLMKFHASNIKKGLG